MTTPTGDVGLTSVPEIRRYVTRLKPLLRLWNETLDPWTLAGYWIVVPRLFAILRHAEQMDVPAGLRSTHQTLLSALACAVEGYLETVAGGSIARVARAGAAAASGMTAFQVELAGQLVAAAGVGEESWDRQPHPPPGRSGRGVIEN